MSRRQRRRIKQYADRPGRIQASSAVQAPEVLRWITLARIYMDSGTQFVAGTPTISPTRIYEGRVIDWGFVDRSMPVPTGMPHIGDARIRLADTDSAWRLRLSSETARHRRVEMIRVREKDSVSARTPFYTGEIVQASFGPGWVEFIVRDMTFSAFDNPLFPNLVNRDNFPDLPQGIDEAFLPIIFGTCESSSQNPEGVVRLPHLGFTSATGDRYGVALHEVEEVTAVYRKLPTDGLFSLVDPSEYVVVQDTPRLIENYQYTFTFLDFIAPQTDGAEIRIDCLGLNMRPAFGGLPSGSGGSAMRNPVDLWIWMYMSAQLRQLPPIVGDDSDEIDRRLGEIQDDMDVGSITSVHSALETAVGDSSGTAYHCDGAIVRARSMREIFSRFMASFMIDMYVNRSGKVALSFTQTPLPAGAEISQTTDVIRNSLHQRFPKPYANRIRYVFARNYATDEWGDHGIGENEDEQLALGRPVLDGSDSPVIDSAGGEQRDKTIEEEDLELWFVRDPVVAFDVASRRASLLSLGSYRLEWMAPGPESEPTLELGRVVELTHDDGVADGGWSDTPVLIYGLTEMLDRQVVRVRGILPVPVTIVAPRETRVWGSDALEDWEDPALDAIELGLNGWWAKDDDTLSDGAAGYIWGKG